MRILRDDWTRRLATTVALRFIVEGAEEAVPGGTLALLLLVLYRIVQILKWNYRALATAVCSICDIISLGSR